MFYKIYLNSLKNSFLNFKSIAVLSALLTIFAILPSGIEYALRFFYGRAYLDYIFIFKVLFNLLVFSPLKYGILLYFSELSKGIHHKLWEVFGFFTSLKLIFRCVFHKILGALVVVLSLLPTMTAVFFSIISFKLSLDNESTALLILGFCSLILALSMLFLGLIFLSKFSMSAYIFVTNPDSSVVSSFSRSLSLSKGKSVYLFRLQARCIIFALFGLIVFPAFISAKYLSLFSVYNKICNGRIFH